MTLREFAQQARAIQPTEYVSVAAEVNMFARWTVETVFRVWLGYKCELFYGKTPEDALAAARAAVAPQVPTAGEMDIGPDGKGDE